MILVLVGEGGAGPHDLVRMMRQGAWAYWTSSQSQYYAEPKRLADLGLLSATRAPGRTHDRTVYRLTDEGRTALAEWLGTPAAFPRVQNEAVVRLLGAEFADPATVLEGLRGLRAEIAPATQWLDRAEARRARPAAPRTGAGHQPPPRAADPGGAGGLARRGRGRARRRRDGPVAAFFGARGLR